MQLGDVHVNKDGTIRYNGDAIGYIMRCDDSTAAMGKWRAEVGDPADPEHGWPRYRVVYDETRKAALVEALSAVEVPT